MTSNPIIPIIDRNHLTGPTYVYWLENLRVFLDFKQISYILDSDIPVIPTRRATSQQLQARRKWMADNSRALGYMLSSMDDDLRRVIRSKNTCYQVLLCLQDFVAKRNRTDRYEVFKTLITSQMSEDEDVGDYVRNIIRMINHLREVGMPLDPKFQADTILLSLSRPLSLFASYYLANRLEHTTDELLDLLIQTQREIRDKGIEAVASSCHHRTWWALLDADTASKRTIDSFSVGVSSTRYLVTTERVCLGLRLVFL